MMISHVCVGTNDFDRALAFYRPLMALLGLHERFCEPGRPWAGWETAPGMRPLFIVGKPFDGAVASPGNGQMVALLAASPKQVDAAFALALRVGGTSEGAPGLRPDYHADYYGAYCRDPDGNKLCIVCHRQSTVPNVSSPSSV